MTREMDGVGGVSERARFASPRIVWLGPIVTSALIVIILVGILIAQQQSSADGLTTDSGARFAAFVLIFTFLIPLAIQGLQFHIPNIALWIAGGVSLSTAGFLWFLVASGQSNTAWAAYGGLQVLRARSTFFDLAYVLEWWACDSCPGNDFIYGPALAWWNWLTFGLITPSWLPILGILLALALTGSIIAIGRMSSAAGKLVVIALVVSPAWLLLLDRANLDAFAILILVAGALLIKRHDRLWAWSSLAVAIWIFGTWKYYPFALGIALLPALRIRRGWLVVGAFLIAAFTYVTVYWQELASSIAGNDRLNFILGDFPAYGRAMLLDRLNVLYAANSSTMAWNLIIAALVMGAAVWGWLWARGLSPASASISLMAAGGSSIFLAATLVGGYGYFYKGAFLIPAIPLIALPLLARNFRQHFTLYTSLVGLTLIVISLWAAYASVLSSLSAFTVAGLALGASITHMWIAFSDRRRRMLTGTE